MTGPLYKLGRACARWRFVVLGLWLVLVVALVIIAVRPAPRRPTT